MDEPPPISTTTGEAAGNPPAPAAPVAEQVPPPLPPAASPPVLEAAPLAVEPPSIVEIPTAAERPTPPVLVVPGAIADVAAAASEKPQPDVIGTAGEGKPVVSGVGVLLVNLGTPDAAEPTAVRRYLKQFLTDRRVIEKTSLFWKLALNAIILPLRSRRKARSYQKIWNRERDESPFKTITRAQAEKLAALLDPLGEQVVVDWAMRYANPSIASRLNALVARGCERILVMPLYPQYAAATTATVGDEVFRFLMRLRRQPALRVLPAYYEDSCYIEALVSSLKAELRALPFTPDVIVASYHGMPKEYVLKGDPYESQCVRTTQLLREQLMLQLRFDGSRLVMTFQSRFGRAQWLQPYTIKTVKALAKKGVKNLVVITPGFSADCLETLEEIAMENARVFKRYGGQNFAAMPCLNDSEPGMLMIRQLAVRELKGWV